jgi:hypothetical protein
MLQRGPYPMHLKRRVASDAGHLSNADCGASLASTLRTGRRQPDLWLAHLSETNNDPSLAEQTTREAFAQRNAEVSVLALPRTVPGPIWTPDRPRSGGSWRPALLNGESRQLSLESLLS